AQGRPDFSGEWMINAGASRFPAGMPVPDGVMRVSHTEKTLTMTLVQGGGGQTGSSVRFAVDGSMERSTRVTPDGLPIDARAAWAGDTLVISSVSGDSFQQVDRWLLGSDKRTLLVSTTVSTNGQSLAYQIAFSK